MGRGGEKNTRIDLGGPEGGLSSNPFASLASSMQPAAPGDPAHAPCAEEGAGEGPVEVRFDRKGRGGKAVTVARWLSEPPDEAVLEGIARACARALGAGARVEASALVVQGRQVERVAAYLEGVRGLKVERGAS